MQKTPWAKVAGVAAAAGLVLTVLLLAFTWPTKSASVGNLPVVVAGPEQATAALVSQLDDAGTFDVTTAADRDAAVALVEEREVYGAVVVTGTGAPEVLTASAAGASPAQILRGVATQISSTLTQQTGAQVDVTVTDLVPLSEDDATGAGLAAAAFPLVLGGVLGGVLVSLLLVGAAQRFLGVLAYGVVGGLLVTLVTHTWFGFLPGSFTAIWLAIGLTLSATAFVISGLHALFGRAGVGIGAAFTVLVGNPLSAAAVPWEFLASPWGAIGQHLVPGASTTLVRTLAYFPEASASAQWLTLSLWAGIGAVLGIVGSLRSAKVRV